MTESLHILWDSREMLLSGMAGSVLLVALCLLISVPLSIAGFVLLQECRQGVRRTLTLVLDVLRCVPFLLFAYVLYYGLPEVGWRLNAWAAGLLALVVYHSAYFVEILRAAAQAIAPETLVAADAFGFSRAQRYRRIVLPQLWSAARPTLANQAVMVIKDSALLMIITVQELTFVANFISSNHYTPFAPFVLAMALYWVLSLVTDQCIARLGPRVARA